MSRWIVGSDGGGGGGSGTDGLASWLFGDGSDGNATITSSTDLYYNNLTINAGATVRVQNVRIFVKGTLTLNGTLAGGAINNGNGSSGGAQWSTSVTVGVNALTPWAPSSATAKFGGAGGSSTVHLRRPGRRHRNP